ncbi:retrotransposon protein, putative, ty1-copia subclass [Tanacetum coccineum]
MRNKINLYTVRDDSLLGRKSKEAASPKLKDCFLVSPKELQGSSLSEVTLLKEATKRSKKDFHISQVSGSGVPDVPKYQSESDYKSWGDSEDDDNDDNSEDDDNDDDSDDVNKGDDDKADSDDDGNDALDSERTDSDDDENLSFTLKDYEEEEHDEEYVQSYEKYEFNDDNENMDEEEYDDLYKDVDVKSLRAEHEREGKSDAEMADADQDVSQEKSYEQVVKDAHVTLTSSQKTKGSKQSSSVSSDFASKFLNLDNVSPVTDEVASMMNVKVHQEESSIQAPLLPTVPVTAISKTSMVAATTVSPLIQRFSSILQMTTPTPVPTTEPITTSIAQVSVKSSGMYAQSRGIPVFETAGHEDAHDQGDDMDTVMSDSEDSTVTYTAVSSPFEDGSDIGSPGVDGPPIMPEDPYAYIMAAYQVPPSPDYIPGPEEPQSPPPLDFVPEPMYPEYIPQEDEILPAEEQPLPVAASPTADSPGYVPESDPEEDDEDPEEDPADYPADRDDDDDDDDDDEDEDEDEEEEEEHPAPADSVLPVHRMTARISIRDEPSISLPPREEVERLLALTTPPPSPLTPLSSPLPHIPSPPFPASPPASPIRPLGYRAAMIRLRAETPSTSHPLPLPTSSPPLQLLSSDHRTDRPEITLPPRKRLGIDLGPRSEGYAYPSIYVVIGAAGYAYPGMATFEVLDELMEITGSTELHKRIAGSWRRVLIGEMEALGARGGIASAAIIDRQLPFEYTITSRSTDVVVMALPVQNINHSAFRSMFEREKLSGTNFNDWLRRLKLVLRVEKKMFVIEQPIPPAPAANSEANVLAEWNALYNAYNEVACLMLGSMTPELHRQFENYSPYDMLQELKSMFEKQAGVERFDLIQTFHACKHEEGKPVGAYVLKMKDYVEQLERLGYVLPQDLSVGLILNGLTSDFTGFVRNYNMHNMGKTIGELHAMLIEYEKGLPKKAETPQVMMIKGGKIQKANKKSLKAKGKGKANGKGKDKHGYISKPKNPKPTAKEHPAKDDTCHHCKEVGHWKRNCHARLAPDKFFKLSSL